MEWFKKIFPNFLSVLRIVLLVPFVMALRADDLTLSIVTVLTILATDFLDGKLARAWGSVSRTGKVLDPLSDKICTAVAGFGLIVYRSFPTWLLAVILIRDAIILSAGFMLIRARHFVPVSDPVGRVSVGIISAALIVYLLRLEALKGLANAATVLVLVASLLSYGRYFVLALKRKAA